MILRALWLRPMRRRPVRFLATVAGVAIGVASVVATALASRAAVASLSAGVEEIAGRARLEVTRPGGVDDSVLARLRPLAGDALLAPVIDETALAPAIGDLVRVLGVDLLIDAEVRALTIDSGDRDPDQGFEALITGRGAALSRALAAELQLAPGDSLELLVRSKRVELEVAGVFEPARFSSAWDRVLVLDVAFAQELFGRVGRLDRVELRPRHPLELSALTARAEALLPGEYRVAEPAARRREAERMVRALDFNLTALSGISILVGVVLVATTLATSVVQRRALIALHRSLGASRRQIAGAILAEAASIGLVGGLLGALGGWAGARVAIASVRATVSTVVEEALPGTVALEPRWLLLGLVLGLGASLVAAVLPLREALRTPPIQALRGERPESVVQRRWAGRAAWLVFLVGGAAVLAALPPLEDRPVYALLAALFLLSTLLVVAAPLVDLLASRRLGFWRRGRGAPLRIAQAALEAGRQRAAWAAAAVAVAVGLAVAMATMVGSFRQTVVDWTAQAMRSDLFLRPLPTESGVPAGRIDPEVVRVAEELFGAQAVDPFHTGEALFDGQRVSLGGAELRVVARVGGVPFQDGRPSGEVLLEAAERRGAIVNEPFSRRFGVARGDTIRLETPGGAIEREVVGVFLDYSAHSGRAILDRADFLARYPDDGARSLALFLPPEVDPRQARAELLAALGGRFALNVMLNREIRGEILRVFDRTFAITVALQLVASAVAVLAVLTVLFALVSERRRELAVVRVLGGSRRQIASVVVGEAGLLGMAGALGGLVVGLAVGWILVAIVNVQSFGWTLRFMPPWGSIAWTVLAVVPACLVAGLAPAIRAAHAVPQEVLREDG